MGSDVLASRLVRFALTPPPKRSSSTEPFAAQLALSRVHPCLVALERTPVGYAVPRDAMRGWFELHAQRGLAGYGLSRALRILLDVLSGLTALENTRTAAGQPFVHGELVPAMVRIDPSGTARLIPLAPRHWSAPGTLPAPERCGHLAPERLLGDAIDARADVFSAGALLWEALAGRRLFATDSVDSIVTRLMGGKVTLPQLPPELSWAVPLKAVVMCALSVDPEQRFANCAELAEAITAIAGNQVASHADLADYFGEPDPVTRPAMIARPPDLPTHHSSLSALVAPVQKPAPGELGPSEPVGRDPAVPGHRPSRRVWAIAAVSCLVGVLGVSAVARNRGAHDAGRSAARSAPPLGASLPSARPLPAAPPAPSAVPAAPVEAAPTPVDPPLPLGDLHDKPSKPQNGPNAVKALAPKLRLPTKPIRSPDKAAAKYGI
ncbi:MAG: hypothetical protein WDO69_04695 [Pseudomonadota bacterium]